MLGCAMCQWAELPADAVQAWAVLYSFLCASFAALKSWVLQTENVDLWHFKHSHSKVFSPCRAQAGLPGPSYMQQKVLVFNPFI